MRLRLVGTMFPLAGKNSDLKKFWALKASLEDKFIGIVPHFDGWKYVFDGMPKGVNDLCDRHE